MPDFVTRPIPIEVAAAYFVSLKQASEPDLTGELEGAFALPLPEVLQCISSVIAQRMSMVYSYTVFAQTLHSIAHESLSQLFQEYADEILETVDYFMQRVSALAGSTQLGSIDPPHASSDALDIIKTVIRNQQEGIALLRKLHAACGDNPMKYSIEQMMLDDQKNIDEMWHHLPPEARMGVIRAPLLPPVVEAPSKEKKAHARVREILKQAEDEGLYGSLSPGHYSGRLDIASEPKETLKHMRSNPLAYAGAGAGTLLGAAGALHALKGGSTADKVLLVPAAALIGGMAGGGVGDQIHRRTDSPFRKTANSGSTVENPPGINSEVARQPVMEMPGEQPAVSSTASLALLREAAGQGAQNAAEAAFFRQRFQEAAQQALGLQQQNQMQSEQLQQLQQQQQAIQQELDNQVQLGQQLQQKATQTAASANQAAAQAIMGSLSAQQDLIAQQGASAQMHQAHEKVRNALTQIVQEMPPSPLAAAPSLVGTPGQSPAPAAPTGAGAPDESGVGIANEPSSTGVTPPTVAGENPDPTTMRGDGEDKLSHSYEVTTRKKEWRNKIASIESSDVPAIAGATIGSALGVIGGSVGARGELGKIKQRLEKLEAQPDTFANALQKGPLRMYKGLLETASEHPMAGATVGAMMGGRFGAHVGKNIAQIAENAAPTIR